MNTFIEIRGMKDIHVNPDHKPIVYDMIINTQFIRSIEYNHEYDSYSIIISTGIDDINGNGKPIRYMLDKNEYTRIKNILASMNTLNS